MTSTSTSFRSGNRLLTTQNVLIVVVLALAIVIPAFVSDFFVSFVLTQALLLGVAAASLIFLAAYGGMISLAQTLMFGVCGFVIGNAVTEGGSKGLNLGLDPWLGVLIGIVFTVILGFVLGAISSRSTSLYFLMITLTFGVIGFFFFGQVTTFSGFGGINQIVAPPFIGEPQEFIERLYYVALGVSVFSYVLLRYVVRTPFGLALQGVRDDPVRMSALGYNVALHRTLAFTLGAFIASLSGVLFVWWNRQIDPATIGIGEVLGLLIVAVIGGINRLEGAWIGAFLFVIVNNYVRDVPGLSLIGLSEARFNTIIGIIFLVIVLVSPNGLVGIGSMIGRLFKRDRGPEEPGESPELVGVASGPQEEQEQRPHGPKEETIE